MNTRVRHSKAIACAIFLYLIFDGIEGKPLLGPFHAGCSIDWTFNVTCDSVSRKIIHQIDVWKGNDCGNGEKCHYEFLSFNGMVLQAKHETPKKHYLDDLTFTFIKNHSSGCNVAGHSTSEVWYAILDYGTNYCNLHNLITGSGLDKYSGYSENTNNSRCTQYSTANCDKY